MATISIGSGLLAIVDDNDLEYLSQWEWRALNSRGNGKHVRPVRRAMIHGRETLILMARQILKVTDPATMIVYKNGNRLDNRRQNLLPRDRKSGAVGTEKEDHCKFSV